MQQILLVEDDHSTREAMVLHLKEAGYAVSEAANGWEALLVLDRGERIDLVLLDLVMPGMDGKTFLQILRNGEKFKDLPIVVMTAYDVEEMKKLVNPFRIAAILGKTPPLWDKLLPAIEYAIKAA
jgi:CheY-like chemotaxis protein